MALARDGSAVILITAVSEWSVQGGKDMGAICIDGSSKKFFSEVNQTWRKSRLKRDMVPEKLLKRQLILGYVSVLVGMIQWKGPNQWHRRANVNVGMRSANRQEG